MMQTRVLLIGFGNMGQALVRGWLERGMSPAQVHVVDPADGAHTTAASLGVAASTSIDADAAGHRADVVLLAVKPAQLEAAAESAAALPGRPLLLSIAAGKTLAAIAGAAGEAHPAVRAMPNTPAAIGHGMTVMIGSHTVSPSQREAAEALLRAVGDVAWLDDEALMDAVTAVSGSGPAYVFLLIEALARAGAAEGLDDALARRLATVTVSGAGAYAARSGEPAAELRRRVTSPGGTTQAALEVLMADDGLPRLIERAVQAAAVRSRELSSSKA